MSPISLTALRSQLFKIVDRVIETGMPVEIERKGHKLKIVLEEKKSKFNNLKKRNCIVGDPDELIELKVGEWNEEVNLSLLLITADKKIREKFMQALW